MKLLLHFFLGVLMALAGCILTPALADQSGVSINVEITSTRDTGTGIMVALTNNGSVDLQLLKFNNVIDDRDVQKVLIKHAENSSDVEFRGWIPHSSGKANNWLDFPKDDTYYTEFDAAEIYDLHSGGNFTAQVSGAFHIKDHEVYFYSSNVLSLEIEPFDDIARPGLASESVSRGASLGLGHHPVSATTIRDNCNDEQRRKLTAAAGWCSRIATSGAANAVDPAGADRFLDYFHQEDASYKIWVHDKLLAVADECNTNGRVSSISCGDEGRGFCDYDTLAWTHTADGYIIICDLGWQKPIYSARCHEEDLATTLLHEMTHLNRLHGAPTYDFAEAEQWPTCKDVSPMKSTDSADNYAYFAQSAHLNCGVPY